MAFTMSNRNSSKEKYVQSQEFFPVAEKILSDIENIFKREPKPCQFGIIGVLDSKNRSPVHYEEGCLGLENWCVRYLYCHAYSELFKFKRNKHNREDPCRISRLSMGALLINPDVKAFWQMRKDMIENGKIDPWFELHFTKVTLTFKPKCLNVFHHRKWIINTMFKDEDEILLRGEFQICEQAANQYPSNYHAWNHRLWIANICTAPLLESEWLTTLDWVSTHISDTSGFNYRSNLIKLMSRTNLSPVASKNAYSLLNDDYKKLYEALPTESIFLVAELSLLMELIITYPGHEALWSHRRSIFFSLFRLNSCLSHLIEYHEKHILNKILKNYDALQLKYALVYLNWIRQVLKVNLQPD